MVRDLDGRERARTDSAAEDIAGEASQLNAALRGRAPDASLCFGVLKVLEALLEGPVGWLRARVVVPRRGASDANIGATKNTTRGNTVKLFFLSNLVALEV